MTDARLAAPRPAAPQVPLALKRRAKHGLVASYIRELSQRRNVAPLPRDRTA